MLIELSVFWTVVLDIVAWTVIHLSIARAVTRAPADRFHPESPLFRERSFEAGGTLYDRLFAVGSWKRHLPDGAALFKGGFRKKRFLARDPEYLARFRIETCRGELAHWGAMAFAPLFFLFNPPGVGWLMIGLAIVGHAPFIMVQRYNRFRLNRVLAAADRKPDLALPATPLKEATR